MRASICTLYHSFGERHEWHDTDMVRRRVTEDSVLAVQIFDQKKFKKKDQGFLGVINVRIGSVIDLDAGGDGTSYPSQT
jgi:hypothetical protein